MPKSDGFPEGYPRLFAWALLAMESFFDRVDRFLDWFLGVRDWRRWTFDERQRTIPARAPRVFKALVALAAAATVAAIMVLLILLAFWWD